MHVKLVVVGGKSAGTVVPVTVRKFFMGRALDCHLRPTSDQVSRHHCAILVGDAAVAVCDLGSRTGTRVNDQEIKGQHRLKTGDRLAVGPLQFEIQVNATEAVPPKPEPAKAQAAPVRSGVPGEVSDQDLSDWLGVPDGPPAAAPTSDTRISKAAGKETVVFPQPEAQDAKPAQDPAKTDLTEREKEEARRKSAMVGVSQSLQGKRGTPTPRDAAADALKNFFGRK